ncbi:hypothetical protein [Mycolicibacterium baixiangningiae]|uniref:hypothetical protein n=1 Tax=Mycolicibacterium baixiangningiae TaxID=2761578 RepID=UPI00355882E4
MSDVRGRVWCNGTPQGDFEFSMISDCLAEPGTLVWADVYASDHAILKDLAREPGLNEWAVEDALRDVQTARLAVGTGRRGTRRALSPSSP